MIFLKHFFLVGALCTLVSCSAQKEEKQPIEVASTEKTEQGNEHESVPNPISPRSKPIRYKVEKGHISYTYDGIQRGTEEVYFSDFGMLEIKFTETVRDNPFSNSEEKISLITLIKDSAIYIVDNSTMNARKIDNALLFESAQESPSLDLDEVAQSIYSENGGFVEKKELIAGVQCDRWFIENAKTREWRHKGIMMKTIIDMPRNYVKVEATAIDTLSDLPEGIFDLPKNVNIQDGMSMNQWVEELNKPVERKRVFDFRDQKGK